MFLLFPHGCHRHPVRNHCHRTLDIAVHRPSLFQRHHHRCSLDTFSCSPHAHVTTPLSVIRWCFSALPPKADICSALAHVCFGPKADIFGVKAHRPNSLPKRQNTQNCQPTDRVDFYTFASCSDSQVASFLNLQTAPPCFRCSLSSFGRTTWPRRALRVGLTTSPNLEHNLAAQLCGLPTHAPERKSYDARHGKMV